MISPLAAVTVDSSFILQYFIFLILAIALFCTTLIIPLAITRRMMGALGKAEFRNKNGIVGVIVAPDGNTAIERLKQHYTGILYSLAQTPKFGRIFFTTKSALIRPVNAPRLCFIDAKSSIAAPPDIVGVIETLKGKYIPREQKPGVPRLDAIESLILHWAESLYYPSRIFTPRIQNLSSTQRSDAMSKNPSGYAQWKMDYLADQREAISFEIEKLNDLSILNEIKTGIIRKISIIKSFITDDNTLVITPQIDTKVARSHLRDDEVWDWFLKMTNLAANDSRRWPIQVGGREVDIRDIFGWNITTFNQGDVTALDAVTKDLAKLDEKTNYGRIIVYAMAAMLVLVGVAVVVSQLIKS